MYDRSLILELLDEVGEAIRRIDRRFSTISKPDDFVTNDDGLDRLDAIAMMLIAIGENFKRIDKITNYELLPKYSEIPWQGVKGIRDILAHDYFNIDNEEIFNICKRDLKALKKTVQKMRLELL